MKYTFYILGIIILTLGISLTIQSNFGTSPFDALLVGLSINVGLTVGSWEIIVALILICCNAFLKRQRPEVLGLVTAFITGIGIDMWLFLLHNLITPELWLTKLICFGIGLVVIGLGTAIYLQTNFAPIPIDRLTLIIQELTKTNILFSRTVIYLLFLIMAIVFSGPIGIGTLLTVCLGGVILNFFMPITERVLDLVLIKSGTSVKYDSDKNHSI
ncbi:MULTISPECIES: YczE/YyaS/YitT family protein [Bacillus cereus group]|uniref:YczE/YyaS/YitT family protein n=1 Tax=Bacillus cereus group TaxID=86661 RepID=UPI0022DEE61E|nr:MULTISPECIES: YitT family protein [unclassified Bacillus cereus group]MDA2663706.1 YitT family protein [Bacillus cereus group sp. Bc032]MDA2674424.1 YitT family protein [Bacillus cereus group sp. Bc031]MDA2679809.1 YitT family protein [Bacillus cereus group sp. Bc029]MDA2685395.1 YitT family protein [Bacillus cereus group sp. Bc030]MDA2740791.1 YitT family protein [Bacillus cereus group sp. Bc011]